MLGRLQTERRLKIAMLCEGATRNLFPWLCRAESDFVIDITCITLKNGHFITYSYKRNVIIAFHLYRLHITPSQ